MRRKRVLLLSAAIAVAVISLLLWVTNDVPFAFLKDFRKGTTLNYPFYQATAYESEGDFEELRSAVRKELSTKGWTRQGLAEPRAERWGVGADRWISLFEGEPYYRMAGDEPRLQVRYRPGKLFVAVSVRKESIWQKLRRTLGIGRP